MNSKDEIIRLLKGLVYLLALSDFDSINRNEQNGLFTVQELQDMIQDYGGKVTFPLINDFEQANIIEVLNTNNEYHVEYDLWINNEKSDLTLTCQVMINQDSSNITIEDIHVL